ncbi:MAG: hypothetical protein ACRCVN_02390 [Spirochaetia bacterium]
MKKNRKRILYLFFLILISCMVPGNSRGTYSPLQVEYTIAGSSDGCSPTALFYYRNNRPPSYVMTIGFYWPRMPELINQDGKVGYVLHRKPDNAPYGWASNDGKYLDVPDFLVDTRQVIPYNGKATRFVMMRAYLGNEPQGTAIIDKLAFHLPTGLDYKAEVAQFHIDWTCRPSADGSRAESIIKANFLGTRAKKASEIN